MLSSAFKGLELLILNLRPFKNLSGTLRTMNETDLMNNGEGFIAIARQVSSVECKCIQILNVDGVGYSQIRHSIHVFYQ